MQTPQLRNPKTALFALSLGGIIALGLVSCASGDSPSSPTSSPNMASSPTKTATAGPTPSTVETTPPANDVISVTGERMDKTCEEILPYESLYAINANWSMMPPSSSAETKTGNKQLELGGISCQLIHETSGAKVNVVVAKLSTSSAQSLLQQPSQLGTESFTFAVNQVLNFASVDNYGVAQIIDGKYWISVSSTTFLTPQDPAPFAFIATNNL